MMGFKTFNSNLQQYVYPLNLYYRMQGLLQHIDEVVMWQLNFSHLRVSFIPSFHVTESSCFSSTVSLIYDYVYSSYCLQTLSFFSHRLNIFLICTKQSTLDKIDQSD